MSLSVYFEAMITFCSTGESRIYTILLVLNVKDNFYVEIKKNINIERESMVRESF